MPSPSTIKRQTINWGRILWETVYRNANSCNSPEWAARWYSYLAGLQNCCNSFCATASRDTNIFQACGCHLAYKQGTSRSNLVIGKHPFEGNGINNDDPISLLKYPVLYPVRVSYVLRELHPSRCPNVLQVASAGAAFVNMKTTRQMGCCMVCANFRISPCGIEPAD